MKKVYLLKLLKLDSLEKSVMKFGRTKNPKKKLSNGNLKNYPDLLNHDDLAGSG